MTHTPTPWRIEGDEIRGSDIVHTNGRARNSLGISSASYSDCVCTVYGWMELEHPKANASFIVQACNAHDELVAALKLWQDRIGCGCGELPCRNCSEAYDTAERILSKVEAR